MSVATALHDEQPRMIGPYDVQYEIGRGGMGIVYCARRADGGPDVALKIADARMADYFGCIRREILALGRLRHPGIVRILEEGVEKGVPWYAMELLDARSLDQLLDVAPRPDDTPTDIVVPFEPRSGVLAVPKSARERPLVRGDLRRALTLMYRLARVLAYVHSHGIVHRDLKPTNVLVRAGDRPVLVDFGLMSHFRARSGREVLEIGGLMMGTATYAAPEQISGELVDARADLYAFGTMLYELVCGAAPFDAVNAQDMLMMHLTAEPRPPSQLVEGVPAVLESLILQLLAKSRADRLGYAEDIAAQLVAAGAEPDPDFEVEAAAYLYRSPMLGREQTLASLRTSLPAVRRNEGAFLVLGGESGIGKTSVAAAFAREATLLSIHVVTGECIPIATADDVVVAQPLHPLRPLMRAIADHCHGRGAHVVERVLGSRLSLLRHHDPSFAALAEAYPPAAPAAPELGMRRLLEDLAETLASFARERPLLLVIDDLQRADEVTLRFLSSLTKEFFQGVPLLIVGTYRADETGSSLRDLLARPHVTKVHLGRLDANSVSEIVRAMLAAPNAPAAFLRYVVTQAEGNPFFVAEYLRAAVAEGLLYREAGHWVVRGEGNVDYESLGLPGTLRELVGRRLEGLSPLARRVAEAAAVLGREVHEPLLIDVCGESASDAALAISELHEHHVFDPQDDALRFVHDKLRETIYQRTSAERRRGLHARAAELLERRNASELARRDHAAELAHHCQAAGRDADAIRYYTSAAEEAFQAGAFRQAVDLVHRAMEVNRSSGLDRDDGTREGRIRRSRWHRLLSAAYWGDDPRPSLEQARAALEAIDVTLPRTRRGWMLRLVREAARQSMQLLLPERFLRARAGEQEILREVAVSAEKFAGRAAFANDLLPALASGLMAVNAADRVPPAADLARGYSSFGAMITLGLGLRRLGLRYFARALRVATAAGDVDGRAHLDFYVLMCCIYACDWKGGGEVVANLTPPAQIQHQIAQNVITTRSNYEYYTGALARTLDSGTELVDVAQRQSNAQYEGWGRTHRSRALLLMGRVDEALCEIEAALRLLPSEPVHSDRISALAHHAQALLFAGQLRAAAAAADVAYSLASSRRASTGETHRAYLIPAEVYLEVWMHARGKDPLEEERMRRAVRDIVRELRVLARRMPLVRSEADRVAGIAACLDGDLRKGEKLLQRAVARAAKLGLPLDEGLAEYGLVRHAVLDPRTRAAHRERARTIFRELGCELYLQKL